MAIPGAFVVTSTQNHHIILTHNFNQKGDTQERRSSSPKIELTLVQTLLTMVVCFYKTTANLLKMNTKKYSRNIKKVFEIFAELNTFLESSAQFKVQSSSEKSNYYFLYRPQIFMPLMLACCFVKGSIKMQCI